MSHEDAVWLVNIVKRRAEYERMEADLAKAQAELEPLESRVEEAYRERDKHIEAASAARLECAKAQARCAELEVVLTKFMRMGRDDGPTGPECRQAADRALTSDGTSALAAVRLAQRALRGREVRLLDEALKALAEAFGSGE